MSLEITPALKRSLGELYYRENCDQEGWACASLERIYFGRSSPLFKDGSMIEFRKGARRINVKVPGQTMREITEISEPAGSGAFAFDYLACKVGQKDNYDDTIVANPLALCWVKIRTGRGAFSDGQIDALEKIKLDLAVFRIRDILAPPGKIETGWDVRSGKEWLDELEDLRDQAESDDDYF
jgi:hypothetical protein